MLERIKAWPLWAKIVVGIVGAWLVVQLVLFTVGVVNGRAVKSNFDDLQHQVDK